MKNMIDILTTRLDELKNSLDEIDEEYKLLKGEKMSANLWNPNRENTDYFVRFDKPHPDDEYIIVWICDSFGRALSGGNLLETGNSTYARMGGIDPDIAKRAGVKLSDGSNPMIRSPENMWDKDDCILTLSKCIEILQGRRNNE